MYSRPLDIIYKQSLLTQIKHILMEPLMDKHPLRTASTGGLDSFNQEYTRSTLNDKLGQMLGGGSQVGRRSVNFVESAAQSIIE